MSGDSPKDPQDLTQPKGPQGAGSPAAAATLSAVDDLDEVLLAAELDAEFDEIRAEIDRINMQERVGGPTKRMLLQQYRKAKKAGRTVDANRPPWRVRLDEALESTIDKFIEDGLEERADGSIALVFKSELIGSHGVPLLTALLDAMRAGLAEKDGMGGVMDVIGPHIIQFLDNFRTSFAGEPGPEAAADAADGAEEAKKTPLPPLSIQDVFKGFSGLMAAAQASAKKPGGKGQSGKKGAKPQTTTFTMKSVAPPSPQTPGSAPSPEATAGGQEAAGQKGGGPTINIDFAGLFGSLMKGMAAANPVPSSPKEAPPAETAASASPPPDPDADSGDDAS